MKQKRFAYLLVTALLALMLVSAALAADMNQDTKPPVDGATTTLDNSGVTPDKGAPEIPPLPPIDSPGLEVVTEYAFSQQLGTYTEIAGGTIHGTSTNDDTSFSNIPLGFDFVYHGTTYTAISIQSNGFIAMGTSISSSYTPISSGATNNIIAALGFDIQGNGGTSTLRSEVLGSAPNRVMVGQWKEYKP